MNYKNVVLDPFQEEAIRMIDEGRSLLVSAPTGAGKTLIAEYAIEKCLREGGRAIYTAPIKALSNQKFRDFTLQYGDRIGIKTGDVTINGDAQVILMTTEIFRNTIFESPEALDDVRYAVFDEIHYLDDIERGTVWEESIIFAPQHIQFVALSATLPNVRHLAAWIHRVRPKSRLHVIEEYNRPVPLRHFIFVPGLGVKRLKELKDLEDSRQIVHHFGGAGRDPLWRRKLIDHLCAEDRLPALYFAFNRRDCEAFASRVHRSLLSPDESEGILRSYDDLLARFAVEPDGNTDQLRTLLSKGVAYHHAGLLPTLKEVIERIFTTGLLKLIFATETFAVGVNMPARTVVFNTIFKYDGVRMALIRTREHHQMSGRAGRRGIDRVGYVYSAVEWPETRLATIEKVLYGRIEPIRSQFNLSYATLLTLYRHLGEKIITACEKSFSNFEPRSGEGRRSAKHLRRFYDAKVDQMRKKLMLLRALGYIDGQRVTPKGLFAAQIYGYELQVTELYHRGLLKQLSEDELSVLFYAIVYESKKGDWHRKYENDRFRWVRRTAQRILAEILFAEQSLEIDEATKPMDFRSAGTVWAWSRGCEWRELEAYTGASDGDLVRYFRLAIQLLRNTLYALPKEEPLRRKLRASVQKLNRDVVDAERQLRLGTPEISNRPTETKE